MHLLVLIITTLLHNSNSNSNASSNDNNINNIDNDHAINDMYMRVASPRLPAPRQVSPRLEATCACTDIIN